MMRSGTSIRSNVLVYGLLTIAVIGAMSPIMWLVTSSVKPANEIYSTPPRVLGSRLTFQHYGQVLGDSRMQRYFFNSILVSLASTVLASAFGMLAGYGFSRFRFPMKTPVYLMVLGSRMVPMMVLILPLYMLFMRVRLLDTYTGLVLAYLARTLPLAIWLFTNFLQKIPVEIDQCAMIDGCNRLQALVWVILPNMGPSFMAVGIYVFLLAWNEYLIALILITSEHMRPITVGLALYMDEYKVYWGPLLAGSMLVSAGPMVLYSIFHRLLSFGLSEGSVKG